VVKSGAADRAGVEEDDVLVEVNGVNAEQSSHDEVVEMIRSSGSSLEMLVANKSVYDRLKARGVVVTRLLLGETSHAQVHSADTTEEEEERREEEEEGREAKPAAERERVSGGAGGLTGIMCPQLCGSEEGQTEVAQLLWDGCHDNVYRQSCSVSCSAAPTGRDRFWSLLIIALIKSRAVKRLKCLIGLITGFCGLIMINHILPIFSVYFVRI